MMTAPDVQEVLQRLDAAGLWVWVDGGWGVDALVGEMTREHADLDLVVLTPELAAVRSLLAEAGYRAVLRNWLPTSIALADGQGREVDLHPVNPTADGGGDQAQLGGGSFHYPPPTSGGDRRPPGRLRGRRHPGPLPPRLPTPGQGPPRPAPAARAPGR
jgi:lincosamide nucleotidyltransferase A/C/D/E